MRAEAALLLVALLVAYSVHSVSAVCGNNIVEAGENCDNTTAGGCCLTNCLSALNNSVSNPSSTSGAYTLPYALTTSLASIGLTTAGANYPVAWSVLSDGPGSTTYDPGVVFSVSSNTNLNWNRVFVGTFNVTFQTVYCTNPFRALYFYRQLTMNQFESCTCVTDLVHPWCDSSPTLADETRCDCFTRQCYRRDSSSPATCGSTKCRNGYLTCGAACNDLLVSKPRSFTILGNDCNSSPNQCTDTANQACTCNAVCGDLILDTGEQCDAGSPAPYGSCCTHNCTTTPINPSPSTGSLTLATCMNTTTLAALGLVTTGSNYVVVYELFSVTNVSGLSATLVGTTVRFNKTYAGVAVVTFRALFCNATSQYVTFTRTITATGCCGNSIVEYGEICDVGPTSGQAGSCCTSNCRTLDVNNGQTYSPVCRGNRRFYTMADLGLDTANIQVSALTITRNQTWYQGVGETNREFYTDWSVPVIFNNASGTYVRFVGGIIGGINITFSYNYCNSPASTVQFWKTIWVPQCYCDYCSDVAGFGPYCNPFTSSANPLVSTNPYYKCDCSKVVCFQRATPAVLDSNGFCADTSGGCFTDGYTTCTQACTDVISPKPLTLSLQYQQTNAGAQTCNTGALCVNGNGNSPTLWVNCSCAPVCGDGVVDTNEFCDVGNPVRGSDICCTSDCQAPFVTSPSTFSFTTSSCVATVPLSSIQIVTTGGNFFPIWSVANYTGLTGLSPSIQSNSLLFGNFYTGTVTFTLRARWCNNPNQYVYVTRTITNDCCDNSVINIGEECDLGASGNGGSSTCCSNNCQFRPTSRVCRASASACDAPENCLGNNATCPPDVVYNSSIVCRPAVSTCDVAENCNGISNLCPTDVFASSSTVCRAATDFCDVQELCTGTSSTCPTNVFKSAGTVCRNATGVCDVQETCTGSSASCPADAFANSSVVCRTAAGVCDQPETCTGTSSTCPSDIFYTNTRLCRNASGVCDVAEYCTGSSISCPVDGFATVGTVCRTAVDLCDQPDVCTGLSSTCPADALRPSNYTCRPSAGSCDVAENCTGSSTACPADTFVSNGVECRPVADTCDLAEVCTGSSATCPTDLFRSNSFVCRSAADLCDLAETCTGSSATCPVDAYKTAGTVCRVSAGACDPQDVCSGTGATCVDVISDSSTVCRTAQGPCDAPDFCDGVSTTCGPDLYLPSTAVCRPAVGLCDAPENCTGSSITCPSDVIRPFGYVCSVSTSACNINTTCSGATTVCPSGAVPAGTACSVDGNKCFLDQCAANGTCLRGAAINYDDGLYCNGAETCDPGTGNVVTGTPPNCDDNNSCTTDTCSNLLGACVHTPVPGSTGSCGTGLGACAAGNYSCDGSGPTPSITCVGQVSPSPEVCGDSIDNNCNGVVDEGCTAVPCLTNADCDNVLIGACDVINCGTDNFCNVTQLPVGSQCTDGRACTFNDTCDFNGICSGESLACDDGNECTYDSCQEPYGRCVFDAQPLIGSTCTIGHCTSRGVCERDHTPCPVLDPSTCLRYVFNKAFGTCDVFTRTGACDDGDACTLFDTCINGDCFGQNKTCDDYIECTVDTCIAPTGVCQHMIAPGSCRIDGRCWLDGDMNPECDCLVCNASLSTSDWSIVSSSLSCDDGDACTENDVCNTDTGICGGTPVTCPGSVLPCYFTECIDGSCREIPFDDGTGCDDDDACTIDDVCTEGRCRGAPANCSFYDSPCVIGVCDPFDGCRPQHLDLFTRCDIVSNNVCAGNYFCFFGDCVGVPSPPCPISTNPCTEFVCDPVLGCIEQVLVGQSCDDNNTCTLEDVCAPDGSCTPGGIWINCDDLDPCTDDLCLADSGCLHVPILNCAACNETADCSPQTCQQVNCVRGQCRYIAEPAGFSCADGDVCNGHEVCTGNGVCVSLGPMTCDDNNPCTIDSCDSLTGCEHTPDTGAPCDDNDVCTGGDTCTFEGVCAGAQYPCPDDTYCLSYECVNVEGDPICLSTAINKGGYCSNGRDPCLNNGVCDETGVCIEEPFECPRPTECIASYTCLNATCVPVPVADNTPCDLLNLCKNSVCINGVCSAISDAVVYPPTPQCVNGAVCIPETGELNPVYFEDGFPCDDDDACTQVSYCSAGMCIGTDPLLCLSPDSCHAQGTCDPVSGSCTYAQLPDYTPCMGDNTTMTSSVCLSGTCIDGGPIFCPNSENECLRPRLDPELGCVYEFVNDGTFCDDDDICTVDTVCQSGQCTGGHPYNCSYDQYCEVTYCLSYTGCVAPDANTCRTCTEDKDCPYIPCRRSSCEAGVCAYTGDDTALSGCNDNQFCNGREFCFAGSCHVKPAPDCDDGNDCTIDTCDFDLQQCRHAPTGNISCQNDDLCAVTSQCDGQGHCLTTRSLDCDPSAPCQESLGCNPKTGACEYIFDEDGAECALPGSKCTQRAECHSGVCNIIENVTCAHECACDASTTCDASTGQCVAPTSCNHEFCYDGDMCTLGDRCDGNVCVPGPFSPCDAFSTTTCQYNECNEGGCVTLNRPDGLPCSTDIPRGPCSGEDICENGQCVRRYRDGEVCREAGPGGCDLPEYCNGWSDNCPDDLFAEEDSPCPDTLFCYTSTCRRGRCLPAVARDCSEMDGPCTIGVCDETSNTCLARPKTENTPCVSGREGQCVPFSSCQSGVCAPHYANELTPCDDGTLCTTGDHCSGYNANCVAGRRVHCSHLDSTCSLGTCNPLTGSCISISANEDLPCNADNNPCTVNDTCRAGACVVGDTLDCSSLNTSCQYGVCTPLTTSSAVCTPVYVDRACDPDYCTGGCTVPFVWWSLHNSQCRNPAQQFTWPSGLEDSLICGQTYFYWSQKRATTIWRTLLHEWLAATLNAANGACVPATIIDVYADVEQLLRLCDTELVATAPQAKLYKSYAIMLKTYNLGMFGPGECTQAPCAASVFDSDFFACLFQTRDALVPSEPVDFFSADTCENGAWDYVSELCQCFVGWAGLDCTECDSGVNPDEMYICVPVRGSRDYALRSVPISDIDYYLDDSKLLELVRITGRRVRLPGDGKVDCGCRRLEDDNALMARDFSVYIGQDNALTYVGVIEENLRLCEQTFDVTILNANPACQNESVTVITPENSTCGAPTDWNYICDCCGPDDDGCVCPHNDVMCLREHVLDEHRRLRLYQLLFIIFASVAGLLLAYSGVRFVQNYRDRRNKKSKQKKQTSPPPAQIVSQRFGRARKTRK